MRNSRQVWVPREGTRLNRFSKANETAGYVDLINDPLAITVPGTEFTAARMNSLEDGVDAFYHTQFNALGLIWRS